MTPPEALLDRADVPLEHTWNAESVFPNHDAWHAEAQDVTQTMTSALQAFQGALHTSPQTLADYMDTAESYYRRVSKLYFYAMMSSSVDGDNEAYKIMLNIAGGLYGQMLSANAFAQPELIAIGEDTLRRWAAQEPRLAHIGHYITTLFHEQAFIRSAEVEAVLGLLADPFQNVEQTAEALANVDLNFPPAVGSDGQTHPLAQSTIGALLQNHDREVRRTAWENYADRYLAFQNTFAGLYITSVKQNVFNVRVRGYDSVLHSQLHPNAIPLEVFHNLIETCKRHLPLWHRYWEARRRALGLDALHPYDIWAPLTPHEPRISYEQAVDWICQGMAPLGDAYVTVLRRGCLQDRWVDIYPNKGKRQGAFSYGTYDTYPFIMMSFDNSLGGMSTLAHELGHSMHSYHSRKHQPYIYSGYSMFVAEVASNFNQAMTRAYLFEAKKDDRDFQLALIGEAMDNIHRYFFIMPTLARLEYAVYTRAEQGQPLTADILNAIMRDLYAEGYGATMSDDPARTAITWAQFGHLYAPYYTFQYATGISAAHALSADILAGVDGAAERYIRFLSAGSSVYPIEALDMAGVDMRTPAPIEKTFKVLESLVDRLEALI